jgi:hypothetical protein
MTARTVVVDSGGTSHLVKRWLAVDSGGVTRLAKRVFLVDAGGTSRLIFANQITALASPSSVSRSGASITTLTTPVTTVSVTGGIGPFTFAWTFSSGGASIVITSPTTSSTAFSATIFSGSDFTGTAQCLVTDSIGDTGLAFCGVHIFSTN